jgi:hypothetical protein
MVAPQVGQKALLENDDERQTEGFPAGPTHSTFAAGNSTQVRVREPECLRQLSQEQVCGRPGRPVARNLTAPQRQPPSYCFGFIWCWGATGSGLRRLTFELTPTAEAGCARREVEHKQARFAAGAACRSGSGAERGVRRHLATVEAEMLPSQSSGGGDAARTKRCCCRQSKGTRRHDLQALQRLEART